MIRSIDFSRTLNSLRKSKDGVDGSGVAASHARLAVDAAESGLPPASIALDTGAGGAEQRDGNVRVDLFARQTH